MHYTLSILADELPKYISEVKDKNSENSKAFAFSSFIQRIFGIESRDLELEKHVKSNLKEMKGRVDAVFGNLIIEFKKDLRSSIDVA